MNSLAQTSEFISLSTSSQKKTKNKNHQKHKLDGSYLGIERCSSAPLPLPFQPSDLLPLPTAASTTCSMMIHLLRKCNYITTLFSDGQRPIPKATLFPNIAEKKGTILPRSRSVIKMNDHHAQYCLTLQRRLTDILEQQVWTPPEGHIPLPAGACDGWNRSSWTRFGFF